MTNSNGEVDTSIKAVKLLLNTVKCRSAEQDKNKIKIHVFDQYEDELDEKFELCNSFLCLILLEFFYYFVQN